MLSDRQTLIKELKVSTSLTQRLIDQEEPLNNNPALLMNILEQQGKLLRLLNKAENNL